MGSGHPDLYALLSVFQTDCLTSPGSLTSSRRGSQLLSASPLKVCLCRTPVKHLTPPLEVPTSSSCGAQAQCQSAEGVPLSDTCQSPHTPCGGSHELQLLRVSPVNSPLKV